MSILPNSILGSLLLLVSLCTISSAISLPGPNTTSGSSLDLTSVKGIYLHLSSNTSSQNIAPQFNVYYYGNDANSTLGKRATTRLISCSGRYPLQQYPENDPVAQQYAPFGTLERPVDAPPLSSSDTEMSYITASSWCNPNRGIRTWVCRRKQRVNFGDEAKAMRYELGRCADDEICFNGTSTGRRAPIAKCVHRDDVAQLTMYYGSLSRVVSAPPLKHAKGVEAIFSRAPSAADSSAGAPSGENYNAPSAAINAHKISIIPLAEEFDAFGIPHRKALHGSATCYDCPSLQLIGLPKKTVTFMIEAQFNQFADNSATGRLDFAALS